MTVPPIWIARVRFTIGVLLVWCGVSLVTAMLNWKTVSGYYAQRLKHSTICLVQDFLAPEMFGPTPCIVFDDAYKENHMLDMKEHSTISMLDRDALVMIMADSGESKKNERGFESRLVEVLYMTGPLSGKKGFVYRYTLIPVNR